MSASKIDAEGDLSETPTTGDLFEVAMAIRHCAQAWEPKARLIGNVRAGDIAEVMKDYLNLRLEKGISKYDFIKKKSDHH